jgi:dihydrofolate reductase
MRQLHLTVLSTVDGFYEGPNADFRYADKFEDDEFKLTSSQSLLAYDTFLFGRKTYELGIQYWTTDMALKADENPKVIDIMNNFEKVVFSTTLEDSDAQWGKTSLYRDDLVETVRELKEQDGKDILLIGSGSLRAPLLKAGLVDRLQVHYFPLILGQGSSLFQDFDERIKLEVARVTTYTNGNILVDYKVLNGQTFPELYPPAEG